MIRMAVVVACCALGMAGVWAWRRTRGEMLLPRGYRVIASGLDIRGRTLPPPIVLRDDELGLRATPDLLLQSPSGVVPVEVKPLWPGYSPGIAQPAHFMQMAAILLACSGDPRIGVRPTDGWIVHVDAQGRSVPDGNVCVPNTAAIRDRVITVLGEMRQALAAATVEHAAATPQQKCDGCAARAVCLPPDRPKKENPR